MEGTNTIPRSADATGSKKRATPTNSPPPSSSTNGSGNKRQRLDSKIPAEKKSSTADFISLGFSDGDGEEEEPETIEKISKSTSLESIVEENEDRGGEDGDDDEDGGLKEKTFKKKRRARGRGKRKLKELDPQAGQDVEEQSEQSNLSGEGEGDSSDSDGGVKITPMDGSATPGRVDDDEEEEEEDKDSFTRRALQAKIANGTQTPEEGQNKQKLETAGTVGNAVATVTNSETDSATPSSGTVLSMEDNLVKGNTAVDDGADAAARKKGKGKDKKERKRKEKEKQRKELEAAKKERRDRAQLDLPKGGDFSNLPSGKDGNGGGDMVEFSDDDDDEGIEINVEMDMDDLEAQQEEQLDENQAEVQAKSRSDDEEGEVDESPRNGDVASEDQSESSDNGNGSPFLDQISAFKQRKYYTAFVLPPFEKEESRPYFTVVQNPDFKVDMEREREAAAPHRIKESKRICNVCTKIGHPDEKCEYLKCTHCGKWNEHFSHACPDAPSDEDQLRVKDMWRRIPQHFHRTTSPLPKLRVACYHCAGIDHFGDDCPRIPPLSVPGSFSLTDINTCGYASQEWLLKFSDKLDDLESGKGTVKYGPAGTKETVMPAPDPFKDYRKIDETPPRGPPAAAPRAKGRNGGGTKGEDTYRPDRAPRGPGRAPQGNQYRARSPVRSELFDLYREPPPPRLPHGLPPRPRSRSPPRHRSGGGGRGGGGPHGGNSYRPSGDHYDRPAHGGGRGGRSGGPVRAYESRAQPPLPNEPAPRNGGSRGGGGRETYRPMPSSSRGSWQKYKT